MDKETKVTEEVKKEEQAPIQEEKKEEKVPAEEKKTEEVVEKKEEEQVPPTEEKKEEEVPQKETEENQDGQGKVEEVEEVETPNAIRVEDLVTKADLQEQIGALNAKIDAIIKENQDLKEANSKLHEKYENGNFGGEVGHGQMDKTPKPSYESFDDYAKQFM